MKIYFCEKCGVSIPLQEVVGGRATARDGKTYCQGCQPLSAGEGGDLKLYFCDNCRVSIPLQDVITNRATAVGERTLCVDCGRLTEAQRGARRDRIQRDLKEREESRYRLHFCDSCNTSIPQSHLVTGRAVMRGGRTFCERCRGRAEGRRVSALGVVGVLLLLGVVCVSGYAVLGSGGGLLAGAAAREQAPDPLVVAERQAARIGDIEKRIERMEVAEKARKVEIDTMRSQITGSESRLGEMVKENAEQAGDLLSAQGAFRQEAEERLGRIEASVHKLEELLGALSARVEELKSAGPVAAPPVAPPPAVDEPVAPPVKPAPKAAPTADLPKVEEAPADVQGLVRDLGNDDPGVRFSAAVELGKKGHAAAILPLIGVLQKDKDVFVRRAATRSLGELNAWAAVPALVEALEDKEFFVAITAHKALEAITGQDFGFKEGLSRTELRRIVQKAKDWWDEHQGDRTR